MKKFLSIFIIGISLTGCTFTKNGEGVSKILKFSLEEISAYSELEVPKNVQLYFPSKYLAPDEPTIHQNIGSRLANLNIEDICEKLVKGSEIIVDCQIVSTRTPHVEFLFSYYNPYNEQYENFVKSALFKTKSKIYPALLAEVALSALPPNINLNNRGAIEAYLNQVSLQDLNSPEIKGFNEFVRSIDVGDLSIVEQEWLKYEMPELHFSVEYPNGMQVGSAYFGSGVVFGNNPYYSIDFFDNKNDLEKTIASTGDQFRDRNESRIGTNVGKYEAEKVIISSESSRVIFPRIIIPSAYGYFLFAYEEENHAHLDHILASFKIH
jgi:hypothetical protein